MTTFHCLPKTQSRKLQGDYCFSTVGVPNLSSSQLALATGTKAFNRPLSTVAPFYSAAVTKNVTTDRQRRSGSASRCSGGRDAAPAAASVGSNRRWVPPSSIKRDAISSHDRNDQAFRRVRGILNKLTPEKFHKLSEELLGVGLDSTQILKGVILLIFDKALDEPKYSSMYALLCRKLCEEAPNFDAPSNCTDSLTSNTFRRLLLAKCQDEFENRRKASEALELGQKEGREKHKMLGNIKFVGELGKQGLLQEAVLHQCVQQLLLGRHPEDLECLCQIMRTVGHRLDTDKAKPLMNQYFERMQVFASNSDLPSRIRFMLQDVVELRRNRWIPRRSISEHAPKTIQQVRDDAARDFGGFLPTGRSMAMPQSPSGLGKLRSGMDDVFSSMPIGVGSLGTGPGVISTDTFPNYSSNMGRPARTGGPQAFFRPKQFQREHHDLFPAYPQRNNNNNNNSAPRDNLPPRFLKNKLQNTEEISLRPAQNSMVKAKPSFVTKQQTPPTAAPPPPVAVKDPPVLTAAVARAAQEKGAARNKGGTQPPPTREEGLRRASELLADYLKGQDAEQAAKAFKDIRMPKKFVCEVVLEWMKSTLEKTEGERELLSQLLAELKKEGQLTGNQLMEALKGLFPLLAGLETEVPRVKSHAAGFGARAVSGGLVALTQLSEPLEGGAHYPLFLLCLQQLHKAQGRVWLRDAFAASKINLLHMLPEMDRTKERLADILEDRGLSFLFPLLRIQADLWRQLQADPAPSALYRWVREAVDPQLHTEPGFVSALVACLLKYITGETTLGEGLDRNSVPEKHVLDREKEMLDKFKPVFQAFLHEHPALQLVALYALQVHCYNSGFPKGMLLRWFMMLYDQEIVEEEAFLKWKEDVNDEYPGKGKALFQVNQWLTWLEEAEEEGSDDGEN